jgi:hypothetical protein
MTKQRRTPRRTRKKMSRQTRRTMLRLRTRALLIQRMRSHLPKTRYLLKIFTLRPLKY